MAQQQIVVFENYGGPVLPSTGGAGTQSYIIWGSGITFCAAVSLLYCFNARKRKNR
jgi:LPXTG-motif cell wall-anchored protein